MLENSKIKWKFVAELIGMTAIVLSLVFVGLQLRQSDVIAGNEVGMARDVPERTCRVADAINRGSDSDMGVAMAKAAIEHVDHELMDHQVRELNLGVSLCHLVLDDTEGALQRLEQAVEDGQVDQWWLTMSHPLYDQFAFEPRYLRAREKIEEMMEEQRQRFLALSRESKI